ncbi:hypothetical protein IB279_29800 [Ensifer sp. ENS06]|uniref:hypothetical protein n=1 Tax=Ensifer sp. ENS06 TaxID=2769276 RepID=UPI0013AFABE6|nr:hypothetical protein [Ensifer sp. ENS06]MBD9627149.1 hypothetical protein [Ensifer sp. ENS06]
MGRSNAQVRQHQQKQKYRQSTTSKPTPKHRASIQPEAFDTIKRRKNAPVIGSAEGDDLAIAPEREPRPAHTSCLQFWRKALDDDKRAIIHAAAPEERATASLHELQPDTTDV